MFSNKKKRFKEGAEIPFPIIYTCDVACNLQGWEIV